MRLRINDSFNSSCRKKRAVPRRVGLEHVHAFIHGVEVRDFALFCSFLNFAEMIKTTTFLTFAETGGNTGRVCSADRGVFRRAIVLQLFSTSPHGVLTFCNA